MVDEGKLFGLLNWDVEGIYIRGYSLRKHPHRKMAAYLWNNFKQRGLVMYQNPNYGDDSEEDPNESDYE